MKNLDVGGMQVRKSRSSKKRVTVPPFLVRSGPKYAVAPNKWAVVGKVSAVLVTLVFLVAAGFYTWTGIPSGSAGYTRARESAESTGLFMTESQVQAARTVPDSENAASVVENHKAPQFEDAMNLTPEIVNQNWSRIEQGLRALESASARKFLVGKWDFSDHTMPYYENPPALGRASGWAYSLDYILIAIVSTNDFAKIARCLRAQAFLCSILDTDHSLGGMIRRNSVATMIESKIRKLIPRCGQNPELLNLVDEVMNRIDRPYDVAMLLKVENYRGMMAVEYFLANAPIEEKPSIDYSGMPIELQKGPSLPKFRQANLARIHEYYSAVLKHLPSDPYDMNGLNLALDAGVPMLEQSDWSYAVLRMGMEVPFTLPKRISTELAYRNTLLQAIAILKSKSAPAKGLPLAGRYRMDLDGSPIRIKKLEKGWVVYSVGADRNDDGGLDSPRKPTDYVAHLSMATVPPEPVKPIQPKQPSKKPAGPYVPAYGSGDE